MELTKTIEDLVKAKFECNKHFNANDIIFKEGEKIKGIYFINDGKIKVTRKAKNNIAVWFAYPKEFIGLNSFFNESENYSFSSAAFGGEVSAILIPTDEFKKILNENPAFKQEIIQELCNRISFTRKRISNMKSQNIKQRFLNSIYSLIAKEDIDKATVKMQYSIKELSELVGTSTQYIKKLITEFQKKKLLDVKEDEMVIDMGKLNLAIS